MRRRGCPHVQVTLSPSQQRRPLPDGRGFPGTRPPSQPGCGRSGAPGTAPLPPSHPQPRGPLAPLAAPAAHGLRWLRRDKR